MLSPWPSGFAVVDDGEQSIVSVGNATGVVCRRVIQYSQLLC